MTWREDNKYSRWYDALMEKARRREALEKPFERHHIWPISLGGSKDGETVRLTFKEHFLAHWLLTKFVTSTGRQKMRYALAQMCWVNDRNDGRLIISSWQCQIARKAQLQAIALREPHKHTEEFKRALSLRNKGNKYGTGQKKGYKQSEESKRKTGEASARWWRTASPKQIAARNKKIGEAMRGDKHPMAKLTPADVREIKRLRGQLSQTQIAKRFNVSQSRISCIQRGDLWPE